MKSEAKVGQHDSLENGNVTPLFSSLSPKYSVAGLPEVVEETRYPSLRPLGRIARVQITQSENLFLCPDDPRVVLQWFQ